MRWVIMIAALVPLVGALAVASDEVRSWRDSEGRLHVEIVGGDEPVDPDVEGHPLLSTSDLTEDEKLSIRASRERRRIQRALTKAGASLEALRGEIAFVQGQEFVAWAPGAREALVDPQTVIDAQQNAFLATERFRHEKAERLEGLARDERRLLREMQRLWNDLEEIRREIRGRFGGYPQWWRNDVRCGSCLSAVEVEEALRPKDDELGEELP